MDELVRWLGEQLSIDEKRARACPGDGRWTAADIEVYGADLSPEVREHMAAHDPDRVLREIDAKRQLVKLHGRATLRAGGGAQYFDTTTVCRSCEPSYQFPEQSWPCQTLRLLALPYADRPGYRDGWRP